MPAPHHHRQTVASVACAIITVSDTRTSHDDTSGSLIHERLEHAGHRVHVRRIVRDEPELVRAALSEFRDDPACDAVLLTGGTGLSPRDTTYEAVVAMLDKRIDGFGELFRLKSMAEIGSAAMLSRAVAGVMQRTVVFSMPGSTAAVRLAMNELILPELGHIAHLLRS